MEMKKPNVFKCDKCLKILSSKTRLDRHVRAVHDKIKDHECKQCKKRFLWENYLKKHEEVVHHSNRKYQCDRCLKTFSCQTKLDKHKENHEKIKDRVCKHCGRAFVTKSLLNRHEIAVHQNERNYPCELCPYKAKLIIGLRKHIKIMHEKKRQCKMCDFTYTASQKEHIDDHMKTTHKEVQCEECLKILSKGGLLQHMKVVHQKIKKYACEKCPFKSATNNAIRTHVKSVHDLVRDFECSLCDYASSLKGDLDVHIKVVHKKIKDMKCQVCDFSAATRGKITTHTKLKHLNMRKQYKCEECKYLTYRKRCLESHTKLYHRPEEEYKELQCMECGKRFHLRENLVLHVRTVHFKIKNFECDICDDRKFSTKVHLENHINNIHKGEKDFKCSHCNYAAFMEHRLTEHVNAVHLKIRPYKCHKCKEKTFSRKGDLNTHIKNVHRRLKTKDYKCTKCEKSFSNGGNLLTHIRAVHLDIRPYKCDVCIKAFARKNDLKMHIKSLHSDIKDHARARVGKNPQSNTNPPKKDSKSSTLNQSGEDFKSPSIQTIKAFARKNDLKMHIKSLHSDIKDHARARVGKNPQSKTNPQNLQNLLISI